MDLIYKELPTVLPFYDKIKKQNRNRENVRKNTPYELISPNNKLLPFQILIPAEMYAKTTKWVIVGLDGIEIDISRNLYFIFSKITVNGSYYIYNGQDLEFNENVLLNLDQGFYYTILTIGSNEFYSEVFSVKKDLKKYVKFEISNSADINPLIYKIGSDKFIQNLYLDTFVYVSEPEIEEEMEKDGNDKDIPIFQKLVLKNKMQVLIPDYLNVALAAAQLHDEIIFTTEDEKRTGFVNRLILSSAPENDGSYLTTDIVIEQDLIVKSSCEEFIKNIEDQTEASISIEIKGNKLIITGNAPLLGFVDIYRSGNLIKANNTIQDLRKGIEVEKVSGTYKIVISNENDYITDSEEIIIN